jgi:hypothetical protein
MNCCLFLSTRSTRSHLMGHAWLISWQRPPWSYTINWCHVSRCCRPKQLMSILSTCHSVCIQQQAYVLSWLQWAATVWIHVMLSLKDSRYGLSSIYSFSHHFEKSATFGTVGCSKVFYGRTQWNFSLCWFCLNFILFVLITACGDVALCFNVRNGGWDDTCKWWDCDESSKSKRTLISSNSRRCLHD